MEPTSESSSSEGHEQVQSAYLSALLNGSAREAAEIVDRGLALGLSPSKLYLKVLMPAQEAMGNLWHEGKLPIAEEHIATQITINEMSRLRHLFRPKASLGVRAMVTSVDGDPHYIGCRVVADFLFLDGWEVDFLGTDTPSDEIVKHAEKKGIDLVGLGITLAQNLEELKATVKALRSLKKPPRIMLGGPAIQSAPEHIIKELAPDSLAFDAKQAVEEARKICGMLDSHASLNQYLKGLGARILEARKARRFSQQDLADGSSLDRAYISSVENGKQNVTIGAVFKLADALEVSIEDLLVGAGKLKTL
jgi:methanogenic corrinoid protein MtbC1/DNA-binding XRE family transcriptional regulator